MIVPGASRVSPMRWLRFARILRISTSNACFKHDVATVRRPPTLESNMSDPDKLSDRSASPLRGSPGFSSDSAGCAYTTRMVSRRSCAKISFGIIAWTPWLTSTTWVIRKCTARLANA